MFWSFCHVHLNHVISPSLPAVPGLSLKLNDTTYGNNSVIEMLEVRYRESTLICLTNSPTCCRARENPLGVPQGEWYYPNGNLVPSRKNRAGHSVYRSRWEGEVRLNRMGDDLPPGKYCCRAPTLSGDWETICTNLSECLSYVHLSYKLRLLMVTTAEH